MRNHRRFWPLDLSVLRLWLSLLVLGVAFWSIGQLITRQILERTYQTSRYVITDVQPKETTPQAIATIRVGIYPESNTAEARVVANDPTLEARILEFSLIEPEAIEQAIAKELDLSLQEVSRLVHYKVNSPDSR
ncbi:MAG: hypothetical protein AAFQ57_08265 [Cyanobacteria bacterium J06626_14]